jgi:CRISPR-associated protein Cmr5
MSKRSLGQQRAAHGLKCIDALKGDSQTAGKYVGYVKGLPAAILANGLGQALATELAAGDKAHNKLAEHVAHWLLSSPGRPKGWDLPKENHSKENENSAVARELLNRIVASDQRAYVWAQAEAIAYVGWLKKLAVAFLSKEEPSRTEAAADDR